MSRDQSARTSRRFHRTTGPPALLLHVASLPSPYGIGDVGPVAFEWIDRLQEAGQTWWQALPLGPTGYGNSPYQGSSSFAANELLISPDYLIEDGLLKKPECAGCSFPAGLIEYDGGHPIQTRAAGEGVGQLQRRRTERPEGRLRAVPSRTIALAG